MGRTLPRLKVRTYVTRPNDDRDTSLSSQLYDFHTIPASWVRRTVHTRHRKHAQGRPDGGKNIKGVTVN